MNISIAEPVSTASPQQRTIRRRPVWKRHGLWLLLIIAVGAVPRLIVLRDAPPGLNQDEAANAWNAWCLLKTGQDQAGVRWPIFYSRCLGENRSTLFIYLLIPFQALGGLNVLTTRLPSAVFGVLTLPLLYYVGARLFGRTVGVMAAGLLAISPWHIQQCRWGHEAAITPFLVVAPLALMLAANLPLAGGCPGAPRPRVIRAFPAGAVVGMCCYGYPAVRLFLPAFLTVAALFNARAWWRFARSPHGSAALSGFGLGLLVTFGPLLWTHLTDGENINKRGAATLLWRDEDPWLHRLELIGERYYGHFGTDFLFDEGDGYKIQAPPGMGQLDRYLLPLLLLGAIETVRRLWREPAARVLLAWVILYPVGDLLFHHSGIHALRSLPGLCGLVLLAGLGAATIASWLRRRSRPYALAAALLVIAIVNVRFYHQFFGDFNRRGPIYHGFHSDLMPACEWLRPRLDEVDSVYVTVTNMQMPYVVTLVGLEYDPKRWFDGGRAMRVAADWDTYTQYGKINFLYNLTVDQVLAPLRDNGRPDRVIIIVRPGESELRDPAHVVYGTHDNEELLIFDQTL